MNSRPTDQSCIFISRSTLAKLFSHLSIVVCAYTHPSNMS